MPLRGLHIVAKKALRALDKEASNRDIHTHPHNASYASLCLPLKHFYSNQFEIEKTFPLTKTQFDIK